MRLGEIVAFWSHGASCWRAAWQKSPTLEVPQIHQNELNELCDWTKEHVHFGLFHVEPDSRTTVAGQKDWISPYLARREKHDFKWLWSVVTSWSWWVKSPCVWTQIYESGHKVQKCCDARFGIGESNGRRINCQNMGKICSQVRPGRSVANWTWKSHWSGAEHVVRCCEVLPPPDMWMKQHCWE